MFSVDPHWYKTTVLESSLTSISYLQIDIFKPLSEAPLKHVIGNIHDNVELLTAEEGISDPLSDLWKN